MINYKNMIPVKVDQNFNNLYISYINPETNNTHYDKLSSFKHYFYYSDENDMIVKKELTKKVFLQNAWDSKKEQAKYKYTYEADLNLTKRFFCDTYCGIISLEKLKWHIGIIDIEILVTGAVDFSGDDRHPITAITVYDNFTDKYLTFAWHETVTLMDKENKIFIFKTEKEMIEFFLKYWNQANFHVCTGWNSRFDFNTICKRFAFLDKENNGTTDYLNSLSPFKITQQVYKSVNWNIFGINTVDYLEIYKKFVMKSLRSFSLNNVSTEELKLQKVSYEKEGDVAESLNKLWRQNIYKYIEYNRRDVELVKLIDDKLKYMELLIDLNNYAIQNLEDSIDTTKIIDNILIRMLNSAGRVVKTKSYIKKSDSFPGGYVFPVKPILSTNYICTFDVNSLYPTIIRMLNISSETLDVNGDLLSGHYLETGKPLRFTSKVKGIFNQFEEYFFNKRVEAQKMIETSTTEIEKNFYESKQGATKILINATYGYLGFEGSRFYNSDIDKNLANAVTTTGQMIIKHVAELVADKGLQIVAGDTDSVMTTSDKFKGKTLEEVIEICKEIQDYINSSMREWLKETFKIKDTSIFNMIFEKVAKRGIHFHKKIYIHLLIWKKGKLINPPKMIYTGVDVTKSSTPEFSVDMLKDIYNYILNTDTEMNQDAIDAIKSKIESYRLKLRNSKLIERGIPFVVNKEKTEYKVQSIHIKGIGYFNDIFAKDGSIYKNFSTVNKGRFFYIKKVPEGFAETEVISIPEEHFKDVDTILKGFELDDEKLEERFIDKRVKNILLLLEGKDLDIEDQERAQRQEQRKILQLNPLAMIDEDTKNKVCECYKNQKTKSMKAVSDELKVPYKFIKLILVERGLK